MRQVRRLYGASPLHLFAVAAALTIVVVAFDGWLKPGTHIIGILAWLTACAIAYEVVVIPLASLLDRFVLRSSPRRTSQVGLGAVRNYVRIPALLSALLLLAFLPLIFTFGRNSFIQSTGDAPPSYLTRWLLATAAMFAISAVVYGLSVARAARRGPMAPLIVLPAPAGQRGLSAPDSSTPAEPQVVAADRTVSGARLHGSGRARKAVAYSALAFVLGAAVAGARAVISRAHNRGDG
jgi:hypothetical protein